jgi:homoprotocatechuate degradation regulator HpaR
MTDSPGPTPKDQRKAREAGQGLVEFPQSLPMALLRAREAVMARIRPMLRTHGVTEQQWRVLRTMADARPMEAGQLAREVFLLRPSLTRILRDLQARGLVQRVASGAGLRRSLLSITDAGRGLIDATIADAAAIQDEIEVIYGAEALAELKRNLATLERSLTRARG